MFAPFIKTNGTLRYTYVRDEKRRPIKVIVYSVHYTDDTRLVYVGQSPIILSKKQSKIDAIKALFENPIRLDFSDHPIGFCRVAHNILRLLFGESK